MKKKYLKSLFLLWFAIFASFTVIAQTTILPFGSSWKYLDNGSNQGTAWRATAFSDASWVSGNAPLGYPVTDGVTTVLSYGPTSTAKYLTTYFRKSISLANPSAYSSFTATIKRDDGVAVYLNGVELYRNNLVANAAYNVGTAGGALGSASDMLTFNIPASAFVAGNNVLAVEIHQQKGTSSDI